MKRVALLNQKRALIAERVIQRIRDLGNGDAPDFETAKLYIEAVQRIVYERVILVEGHDAYPEAVVLADEVLTRG